MKKIFFFALSAVLFVVYTDAAQKVTTANIDWKTFLEPLDLYWDTIPAGKSIYSAANEGYYGGAIMGNGLLGVNFYKQSADKYRISIGRTDVTEGRNQMPEYRHQNPLYNGARLPIGYFVLTTKGKVSKERMRLSLYDAVTKGIMETDRGKINFKIYVHATKNYIVFETKTFGGEMEYDWDFVPLKAISPRVVNGKTDAEGDTLYLNNPNPAPKRMIDSDINLSVQNLICGKTYIVAWKAVKAGTLRRIIATISQEDSETTAIANAKKTINEGLDEQPDRDETLHKSWWHNFYPSSFISFPHTKMEAFYWIQLYKFACSTRPDKQIVDLQGPWAVENTPWPAIWHNLNIQLTYSWQYKANLSDFTRPLWTSLAENIDNLTKNVTDIPADSSNNYPEWTDAIALAGSSTYDLYNPLSPKGNYEVGNLTWLLFYYWQYCIYNDYVNELKTTFFDLLKRAVNYYIHIGYDKGKAADGKYHLPPTYSPEYGGKFPDCNYDLSSLRWGLQTLLQINGKYNLNDAKAIVWQDFLDNLTDYPVYKDEGFILGEGQRYAFSHRHYSHLLMIYPYYTINWDQLENRELIRRSVDFWQSKTGALQGYSVTGSAAMYASMGCADSALHRMNTLLDRYVRKNTLYAESGPVFETPQAGVSSIHEFFLQTWGGKIRVFPAVPSEWKDVSFINLRTEGSFLISASRKNGHTAFIQVESEAGGLCRLQIDIKIADIKAITIDEQPVRFKIIDSSKGLIEIPTEAGDVFQITNKALKEIYLPQPVIHPEKEIMPYGVNRGAYLTSASGF